MKLDELKSGNKFAILNFYKEYSPKIKSYLKKRVPDDTADEILNDVFLDAIDELPFLKHHENILGWLYRIARNKSIDYYRKKKIKSILLSQIPYLEIVSEKIHEPEFIMEKEKLRQKIEKVMKMISDKYASILRMHYEDGMRLKEIALELNLSFKATESLLFRARKQFVKTYSSI